MNKRHSLKSIDRIKTPSREQFDAQYVSTGTPVILTDAMESWPAKSKWGIDYFRSQLGDTEVPVRTWQGHSYYQMLDEEIVPMTLNRYLDVAARGESRSEAGVHYYSEEIREPYLRALASDIKVPAVVPRELVDAVTLWIGSKTVTPLHYHNRHQAFLCCVVGARHVVLYPPEDSRYIEIYRPSHAKVGWPNYSTIDFDAPDLRTRYPKVERCHSLEALVEEGELLFIPIHWWHLVRCNQFGAAVTFFWNARLRDWHFPLPGIRSLIHTMVGTPKFFFTPPRGPEHLG